MPNHIYGIISITTERRGTGTVPGVHEQTMLQNDDTPVQGNSSRNQGGETPPLRTPTLGQIVAYFKYQSTKEMNSLDGTGAITKFWQRNYYERII